MTDARRASLLAYCRIDELNPEEETLLEALYGYAVSYLAQAGVSEPQEGSVRRAQYELCVNYLVLDAWDRREISITGTGVTENPVFRRILNQLKLTEPASAPPTGSGTTEPGVSEPDTPGESE